MKTLGLFIFIDALGWEVLSRHGEFLEGLAPHRRPLETILGYSSACDPSIISGLLPSQHKLWSSYYYNRGGQSRLAWTRIFSILPDALASRARVRHYLSRFVQRASGIAGYFQLYNVPFRYLPIFEYAEWKRIWEPGGLPEGRSIFDLLKEAGLPWSVHDSRKGDDGKLADLEAAIREGGIPIAYVSLGRLDALMHAEGTRSPRIGGLLQDYDRRIRTLMELACGRYERVDLYVFTDHGMHDIVRGYDLQGDIARLGLQFGRDYVAFYDSTMGRFWPLNDDAARRLAGHLAAHPEGRLLGDDELRSLGVYFPDGQYGDLIFLMSPGVQIAPSFMGRKAIAGMHGFHPSEPDSKAMICSNRELPPGLARIEQIFPLLCHAAGLPQPAGSARLDNDD